MKRKEKVNRMISTIILLLHFFFIANKKSSIPRVRNKHLLVAVLFPQFLYPPVLFFHLIMLCFLFILFFIQES